jgi:hypothetical protein
MKILLDTCVWGGVAHELRAAGHEEFLKPLGISQVEGKMNF